MPIQSEFDSSQTHIAILANTEELALRYGRQRRRNSTVQIIPLWRLAELYTLYGKSNVPFDVVPGTRVLPWHTEVMRHVNYGRLVPIRDLKTSDKKDE
jgi:hypothetical protein